MSVMTGSAMTLQQIVSKFCVVHDINNSEGMSRKCSAIVNMMRMVCVASM